MPLTGLPPVAGGDATAYSILRQLWARCAEIAWAIGAPCWPPSSAIYASFKVTGLVSNGNNTYTLTGDGNYTLNQFFNVPQVGSPPPPQYYDLIIDDPTDETQVMRFQIRGVTAGPNSQFTLGSSATAAPASNLDIVVDAQTSGWIGPLSSLLNRRCYVLKTGGMWWASSGFAERWPVWPNDQESSVGTTLAMGAVQGVTSLACNTVSGTTTATATVGTSGGHSFITGDSVVIAGATSSGSHYNGTFSVTVISATQFTYLLSAADSSPAGGTITATCAQVGANDPSASFPAGKYSSGYQLMLLGSDGYLKRITLTGNETKNLYFARVAYTFSGQYGVVASGNKYRLYNRAYGGVTLNPNLVTDNNPLAGPPFHWNHGPYNSYYTHLPNDSLGTTKLPLSCLGLNDGLGGTFFVNVFDTDFTTEPTDANNTPDNYWTPDIYKTIRMLQALLEGACNYFVDSTVNFEGLKQIVTFCPATWFVSAGVGTSFTVTSGVRDNSNTGLNIPSTVFPYVGMTLYYAALSPTGDGGPDVVLESGLCKVDSATHLTYLRAYPGFCSAASYPITTFGATAAGQTLLLATGPPRRYPEEFAYWYSKNGFIPGWNAGSGMWQDPPTAAIPGSYIGRTASTFYLDADAIGIFRDDGNNNFRPDQRAFQTGDFARYVGDNWNDPTVHSFSNIAQGLTPTEMTTSAPTSAMPHAYWAKLYEGLFSPTNQALIDAAKNGTVTAPGISPVDGAPYSIDTTFQIQDTSKHWWSLPGNSGSFAVGSGSISSTATSGSATSLVDSTQAGTGFWMETSRWSGFVVEIKLGGVWYKRVIGTSNGTTGTLTWGNALPSAVTAGTPYVINSPKYENNRWNGRKVLITAPNGSQQTITASFNDDNTYYFATLGSAIPTGSTYQIQEVEPGGVWKWNGSQWVVPTGNDTRSGSSVPWQANQTANEPDFVTRYGRATKGDYSCGVGGVLTDLLSCAAILKVVDWNKISQFTWTANGQTNQGWGLDGSPQICFWTGAPCSVTPNATNSAVDVAQSAWGLSSVNGAPFGFTYNKFDCTCYTYGIGHRYAYGLLGIIWTDSLGVQRTQAVYPNHWAGPKLGATINWWVKCRVPTFINPALIESSADTVSACAGGAGGNLSFNAMGDGVLYEQWHKWGSTAISADPTGPPLVVLSPQIGSDSMPNSGGTPVGPAPADCPSFACEWEDGWIPYDWHALIDYSGGFQYLP